jgi:DNA-binding MarR family transcriptional regulator
MRTPTDQSARDHVDWIGEQWLREHPDLDIVPLATWGRLKRTAALFDRIVDARVKPFRLRLGEFEVLAALRRAGPPFQMNPTDLGEALIVSGGTITNRIERLERKGLVVRTRHPDDGRGVLVTLTKRGRELFDAAFASVVELLADVVEPIDSDQEQLADILRRLLVPFGERAAGAPPPPAPVPRRGPRPR